MAEQWIPYVVQQGDHLKKIAFRFGVDPDVLWSADQNKELVARRKKMGVLYPGDVVYVPSKPTPALDISAGEKNRFRGEVPTVSVTLHLDAKTRPVANQPFIVLGAGPEAISGTTDADGVISFRVPVLVREVQVRLTEIGLVIPVHVGGLDPISERSGVTQRLRHLGYLPTRGLVPDATLAQAVRAFQRDHRLRIDGNLTEETLQALEAEHLS